MTKDTGDLRQFRLPRDDESSQPGGRVLEVTTSYMYGKHGIDIRIWSVSQDKSWVRISFGTIKDVVDSNYNNTVFFGATQLKTQSSRKNYPLTKHGGNHPTPRAPTVWVRPRQANNSQSKERGQTREQPSRPTSNSTS